MIRIFTISRLMLTGLILVGAMSGHLLAQTTGGPDAYGYIWRDSNDPSGPAYSWVDITSNPGAVMVSGLADDNLRGPFIIGFPFHYYWYDVTKFYVGSNGYMGFTPTSVAHPFPMIPLPTQIQNYLAAMTSDLTFTDPGGTPIPGVEAWYWTNNSDSLVLSYINVPFWDPLAPGYTGSNTFQIILSNVDSSITFQYQAQNGVYSNPSNFCTIGIENISGAVGLQHTYDILPPSIYAIKFYYPSNSTYVVNDASTVYNNNITTGGLFLSKNGAPFTMNTQIGNTGNQPLAAFNVFSRVVNSLNQPQVSSTVQSSALTPSQTEDIIFPNTFTPVASGTFRYINDTQLAGDATPSNNQKVLELQVVDTTVASILLSFDNGTDAGLGGLSWQGGGGGAGVEFVPPFYPCQVTQVRAYIVANANFAGFAMMVLDDDGPNGTPNTVLDSVWVDGVSVITGAWNNVALTAPITVDSGSFYVAWMMGADGISLGQNQLGPFSNRTFEVLGLASNPVSWSDYRYREIEDLMINAYIVPGPVGLNENNLSSYLGNIYPNPANEKVHIDYNFPVNSSELEYSITDVNGREVLVGKITDHLNQGTLEINVAGLDAGIYLFNLRSNEESYMKKLTVVR